MPQFDELLGIVTFATAGMLAGLVLQPVPSPTADHAGAHANAPIVVATQSSTTPIGQP